MVVLGWLLVTTRIPLPWKQSINSARIPSGSAPATIRNSPAFQWKALDLSQNKCHREIGTGHIFIRRPFEISPSTDQILRDSSTFAEIRTKTVLSSANILIRCLFEILVSTDQIHGNSSTFRKTSAIPELGNAMILIGC
jgi:hypothetical protein